MYKHGYIIYIEGSSSGSYGLVPLQLLMMSLRGSQMSLDTHLGSSRLRIMATKLPNCLVRLDPDLKQPKNMQKST